MFKIKNIDQLIDNYYYSIFCNGIIFDIFTATCKIYLTSHNKRYIIQLDDDEQSLEQTRHFPKIKENYIDIRVPKNNNKFSISIIDKNQLINKFPKNKKFINSKINTNELGYVIGSCFVFQHGIMLDYNNLIEINKNEFNEIIK